MDSSIDELRGIVRQGKLARPEAALKVRERGNGLTQIHRLAGRTEHEERNCVEDVSDLAHQEQSRRLMGVRRSSKILLKETLFLRLSINEQIGTTAKSAYRSFRNAASQSTSHTRRPSKRTLSGLNKSLWLDTI